MAEDLVLRPFAEGKSLKHVLIFLFMANWLIIGGILLSAFVAKQIKEMSDVRSLERMAPEERIVVFERRNFYDNHA